VVRSAAKAGRRLLIRETPAWPVCAPASAASSCVVPPDAMHIAVIARQFEAILIAAKP